MENIYYVYIHYSNLTNEPFYVGKGKGYRMKHKSGRSKEWNDIAEHGYYFKLVAENLTNGEANKTEIKYIKELRENGTKIVNKTSGGCSGANLIFTQEHKDKISKSKKGKPSHRKGKKLTEEHKNKISESNKGMLSANKGKKFTESHIEKLSNSHKGKEFSEEHVKNLSESHKGKKRTEEEKEKISASLREFYRKKKEGS